MSAKVPNYVGPHAEKFDAAYATFEKTIKRVKEALTDGLQLSDVIVLYPLAAESYDIAREIFKDASREETIEVARYIYWAVSPNIPWIPEPIETKLEKWAIIDLAIPLAVGAAWDAVAKYKAKKGL